MLPLLVLLTAAPAMPAGLEFIEKYDNGADGISGLNGAEAVAMSPDGAHVYAAGLESDAVTAFATNATTGELTFIAAYVDGAGTIDGLNGARAVTVSPDGKHVYAAGYQDGAVAAFSRDAGTGTLTFVQALFDGSGSITKLEGAHGVTVSPDGAHVYVAGNIDDAVTVFRRDATTGMLTFVEQHADGSGGTNRLDGAETIALSPDGKHVYLAAEDDDALNVFSRDAATGALTLVEVQESGVGGVTGLNQVHGVTLSPDGAHVYTAAGIGASVAVFARNATTGALTFIEQHQDGVAGVQGLDGAETVVVSPNGALVYVTGDLDDALVVFTRNASTGALTFVEYHRDGSHGVGGLDDAECVVVSPDGAFVYVAGEMDDALVLFGNRCGNGTIEADEACDDGNPLDGDCCSSVCGAAPAGTACAGDGNGCTDDACNGAGICLHVNNSAPCDDGAFCTVNDACQGGACQGAPRDCSAAGDQCNAGVCDEMIDACVPQPVTNGTGCNDGNACTQTDACTAGACVGASPLVCTALDQCHAAGTCNPGTGLCSNPVKANGTGCDDGNACTQSDACTAGACVGANPVVCTALDQCHVAGTCNPGTGLCSNPAMADGTGCDDGNACTQTDACVAGICAGADPVICTALDCCHAAGTCDPGTGLCSNPAMADGTECEDGNACTRSDACMAGVCVGANPVVCKALDECHDAGQCDPETGACSNPAKADGARCNIADLCVENAICIDGACVGESTADGDGDGVCDSIDLCPQFPNADQWDMNHNGIGDQCECNADAPGRCLAGGGSARTDCLLEFAPVGPPTYNRKGTKVKPQLTCKDGDPACDMDGKRDGRCTFGVSICLGNEDPRFANCNPAMVYSVEVMTPRPDRITPPMNYVNARRLELAAKEFGLEVRRRNRAISKFGLGDGDVDITPVCGPAFELMVPAPKPKARRNAIKRRFRINAESVDGRHDGDRFLLICK
jgi:cysteine-rich repeat protein